MTENGRHGSSLLPSPSPLSPTAFFDLVETATSFQTSYQYTPTFSSFIPSNSHLACSGRWVVDEVPQPFPLILGPRNATDLPIPATSSCSPSIFLGFDLDTSAQLLFQFPWRMAVPAPVTPGQVRGIFVLLDSF